MVFVLYSMYLEGWIYFINFEARNQHSLYDHNFISYSLRVVWWPVRRAHTKTRLAGIHFCSFFLNIFIFWIFMKHSLNIYYIYLILFLLYRMYPKQFLACEGSQAKVKDLLEFVFYFLQKYFLVFNLWNTTSNIFTHILAVLLQNNVPCVRRQNHQA